MAQKTRHGFRIPIRMIISAVAILLQITAVMMMVFSMFSSVIWFYLLIEFLSIILSISIVTSSINPSYKLSWIAFILIIPFVGVTTYMLWGNSRILPHLRKRMAKSEEAYRHLLPDGKATESKLAYEDLPHLKQASYLSAESDYPAYCRTETEYLAPGEVFLPRLLEELNKAEEFIFIEFFILAEGKMWDEIHSVLKRKAAEGVEVRVIFDDFGSITRQAVNFTEQLQSEGILVSAFNKIRPSVDIFMNNRNHRKIIVIDGKVAFTGGINIGDEYINEVQLHGYWMDSAVLLRGDAVRSFTVMFLNMWTFNTRNVLPAEKYTKPYECDYDGFVLPYCDSPLNESDPAEGIYLQMLNTSQRYVYITSPYLIIGNEMMTALTLAAKSGIDVRIITPKKWDKWYVHPVTQHNYQPLLKAGVKIYEYTPGFIHSKLFVSDDVVATAGTVNMDYRSFFIHFECGAWMCKSRAVTQIKEHFLSLLEQSEEIVLEEWKKRPLWTKIKQQVLAIFSPFM